MFEGKTTKGLARANAAILIGLIEELIERRVMARERQEAANKLENCPTADWSKPVDAIAIIRKQLLPQISAPAHAD